MGRIAQLMEPRGKPRGISVFGIVSGLYLFSLPVLAGSWLRLTEIFTGIGQDARYLAHPWLTALHLAPGMVFFLIGPLQVLPHRGVWHRWRGRVFVVSGLCSGAGVIGMVWVFPALGGLITQLVTTALNLTVAALMLGAIRAIRLGAFRQHRALMIRAYGLGLSVASARWFIMLAEAAGIGFQDSFVIASATGVVLNVLTVELLLAHSRRR